MEFCADSVQELRGEWTDTVLCRESTGTAGRDSLIQFCTESLQELRREMV